MPADVSLGIAVQEQDRRAAAAMNDVDDRSLSFDLLTNEFVKHEPGYNALFLHKSDSAHLCDAKQAKNIVLWAVRSGDVICDAISNS